jgi:predicted alpha-1,2-mannosidase
MKFARNSNAGPLHTVLAAGVVVAVAAGLTVASGGAAVAATDPLTTDPAQYVDPFVGSSNAGNTYPGAVAPFGMVGWSPDQSGVAGDGTLRSASPSGYDYSRDFIRGFGLTHVSGAGCAGLSGDIPFMPVSGTIDTSPSAADAAGAPYQSTFSHNNEDASPGAYHVALDSGVDVSLSATSRTGSGRFTYPEGTPASMLIRTSDSLVGSSDASVHVDAATRTISGSVTSGNFCGGFAGDGILQKSYYTVYFTVQFDKDFTDAGTWQDGELRPQTTEVEGGTTYPGGYPPAGKGSGAYVSFDTSAGTAVNARVGISYVSLDNAEENLETENPAGTTIDQVQAQTRSAWNEQLNRIQTGGGTDDERTTFYTALYHALLHPNITSDVNGEYTGFDLATHTVPTGQNAQYATFSGWDVYRSQVQLVTLLDPERGSDIAASLLNQADQNGGEWDRWTHNSGGTHVMVGDPSAVALAGIVAFGGTDFPVDRAYQSLKTAATVPTENDLSRAGWNIAVVGQRPSLDQFLEHGYYPEGCNAWGCPNETLEMAAADYGLATLADYLGSGADYEQFVTRSQSWQNQFNLAATPDGGYIQGRNADGSWTNGFNPASSNGFVEGTSAQYTWMVQHNPAGLFAAMGGAENASRRLDGFFHEIGDENGNGIENEWTLAGGSWDTNMHSNVDNEPSIGAPWLYNYAGKPWKTQETVRATIQQLWLDTKDGQPNGPDGIPGNDDLGEMSSWLVFAAMGMYPENPSRSELTVAAPLFTDIVIHRASGQTITVSAPDASIENSYIQSMTVNGIEQTATFLDSDAITGDTSIGYALGSTANEQWGAGAADAPPSVRDGEHPVLAGVDAATDAVRGGTTDPVAVRAQRFADTSATARFSIEPTEGLMPDVAEGDFSFDANGTAIVPVVFRSSADAEAGMHPVVVHFTANGQPLPDAVLNVMVREQGTPVIDTSFEDGQARPTDNTVIDTQGWSEYCCGIGGPETKLHQEKAHTGSNSIVYSGRAAEAGASATTQLLDVDAIRAQAGSTLSWSVYPQAETTAIAGLVQDASQYVAVDLLFDDGTRLSDSGVATSNGATLDPIAQGQVLTRDAWNDVSVVLPGSVDGKIIDQVVLHFSTGEAYNTEGDNGYLRGWVDDLRLTQQFEPLSAAPIEGLEATVGEPLEAVVASFTGGSGASADDFSAVVQWGDDTEASAGRVVAIAAAAASGYTVSASHTYAAAGDYNAIVTITDADGVQVATTATISVAAAAPGDGGAGSGGDGPGVGNGNGGPGSGAIGGGPGGPSSAGGTRGSDGILAATGSPTFLGTAGAVAVLATLLGIAFVRRRRAL